MLCGNYNLKKHLKTMFFFWIENRTLFILICRMNLCLWFRVNITLGTLEERMMLSGMHTVGDIFCCCCGQILGWKYVCSVHSSFVISIWDRYHVILIHFYLLRRRHTRRVRNTKKESSFLKGTHLSLILTYHGSWWSCIPYKAQFEIGIMRIMS